MSANLAVRLKDLADRLQPQIDHKFADRVANTPKRAREAASARLDGFHLERTQRALRTLAVLHDRGEVPEPLAGVKTKAAVHKLTRAELIHGGYYEAPRETGKPASNEPAAVVLWDLVQDGRAAERLAAADLRQKLDDVRFKKIPGYFSTPEPVIEQMIDRIGLVDEPAKLLEPGAGSGAILDFVKARFPSVQCAAFEIAPALREILQLKGYELEGSDFLEPEPQANYDHVVMNPPFEKEQDIIHVLRAFEWLKPGGRLVSVMSAGARFRETKRARTFRDFVVAKGGWFEDQPDGSFKESGTGVSTVIVVIEK
ncbi:methyltransferase domain-containing protein [Roseibium album]|uniref:methyltransferase domain-containing protein n=1 Tax=Roseibium album TaxID=311410 RepID=UPI00391C1929